MALCTMGAMLTYALAAGLYLMGHRAAGALVAGYSIGRDFQFSVQPQPLQGLGCGCSACAQCAAKQQTAISGLG